MKFVKYEGAGNDFILIDDRSAGFPVAERSLIQRLCHRQRGIGADGVLLLQNSAGADFRMRIFNADGSEAEMCGNGIRCLVHFLRLLGYTHPVLRIETQSGVLSSQVVEGRDAICLGPVRRMHWDIELFDQRLFVLDTGVPHAVLMGEEEVFGLAPKIRHADLFAPKGVNVNVCQVLSEGVIRIRTYERGVEGETLACGTGCAAAAYVVTQLFQWAFPVSVVTASGEVLKICGQKQEELFMIGPVTPVFKGEIYDHWNSKRN